jgi:hypothetical protein
VATTPRQAVEAAFETLRLAAGFTCDQAETELLLAIARERGYSPLALCPCGKVVPVIDIPGLTERCRARTAASRSARARSAARARTGSPAP